MTEVPVHIWAEVQDALREAVGEATYDIWLAPLAPVGLQDGCLDVEAPAEISAWVSDRFRRVLGRAASSVVGEAVRVDVVARDETRLLRPAPEPRAPEFPEAELNPKFTFDQFVIGDANRFAHAAALAVAELPGQAYNPLFICGPPGLGKTHLLHAIGNYVRALGGGMTVHCTSIERFTNEFVSSLQRGSGAIDRFKGRYRRNDVLLIDDVQFLESKAKTEEEFFHTFNALMESGSQLVLTSDRLPRDLAGLQDRLRARFEAGLVVDVRPPDQATRLTVLRKRVAHDAIALPDPGVLELIADRIPTNVRALEGALIRIVAYASLTGRAVDTPLATEVLDGLYGPGPQRTGGAFRRPRPGLGLPDVTVARVQELVCEAFSLSREELLSTSRAVRVAWPRQIAMYLAREHTSESLPSIGRSFGGRGHTTVMHAVRRTSEKLRSDPQASEAVRRLTERLIGAAGSDRRQ